MALSGACSSASVQPAARGAWLQRHVYQVRTSLKSEDGASGNLKSGSAEVRLSAARRVSLRPAAYLQSADDAQVRYLGSWGVPTGWAPGVAVVLAGSGQWRRRCHAQW